MGEAAIEHGEIVVVIAGGEDVFALDANQPGEFTERRAFAVGLVAEAQVDGVAHEVEAENADALDLEERADFIHLGIGIRDDADHAIAIEFEVRPGLAVEAGMDVGEQRAGLGEKPVVIGGAALNGGVGTVFGAIVGALLIRIIDNGLVLSQVDANWFQFAIGTLTILAVISNAWLRRTARRIKVEA